MKQKTRILTILGSPHDKRSNTRAFVADFVDEMELAGLDLEHEIVSLGRLNVGPCRGCWNCTKAKPCPLGKDDLESLKLKMIECDMLILACPVYTNQVTAQMKALFDRLFTWCHIFPLLGKYSLSACTTGNDGQKAVGEFFQMMLATYGTFSFGHISSIGGFTPGFFPFRARARKKYKSLAAKAAEIITNNKRLPVSSMQKKMFKVMHRKMSGANTFRYLADAPDKSDTPPPAFKVKLMKKILAKSTITEDEINIISTLMQFEYSWWKDRGWFKVTSFKELAEKPRPRKNWRPPSRKSLLPMQ